MELAQILVQLWRRRLAVLAVVCLAALAAVAMTYRISVSPPGLTKRSISNGTAQTRVFVDSPRSSVGDLNRDFGPLTARAQVLSSLMTTAPVVDRIAKIVGVPASAITASSDNSTLNVPASETEPTADIRATDITREGLRYRLTFRAEPEQPTVTIFGQAPTAAEAVRIANAAAKGAAEWVQDTQNRQLVPPSRRTQLTQLGAATGGVVNSGASRILAALIFVAIVGFGTLLVLLVGNTIPAVRRASSTAAPEPRQMEEAATVNGNGNGHSAGSAATRLNGTDNGAKAPNGASRPRPPKNAGGRSQRPKTRTGRRV
jgi:hypothetical protein